MARVPFEVRYSGPFFSADPAKTMRGNFRDFVWEIARQAAEEARQAAPYKSGQLYMHIRARQQSLAYKPWMLTAVVSTWGLGVDNGGNWHAPGVRIRRGGPYFNYAGKIEATHPFMARGEQAVKDARRANKDLLRGLT